MILTMPSEAMQDFSDIIDSQLSAHKRLNMNLKKYLTIAYWGFAIFLLIYPPLKYCYSISNCVSEGHNFLWSTTYQVDFIRLIIYQIAMFLGFALIWKFVPGDDLSGSQNKSTLNEQMLLIIGPALKSCSEVTAYFRIQGVDLPEAEYNAIVALGEASSEVKEHFRAIVREVYKLPKNELNILANEFIRKQK